MRQWPDFDEIHRRWPWLSQETLVPDADAGGPNTNPHFRWATDSDYRGARYGVESPFFHHRQG